jgi:carbon storage regulator
MLVLTRRAGQSIRIGANVELRVVRIEGDRVVLGIAAPRHVAVVRSELVEEVSGEIREAAGNRAKLRVMLLPHVVEPPISVAPIGGPPPSEPESDSPDGPDSPDIA